MAASGILRRLRGWPFARWVAAQPWVRRARRRLAGNVTPEGAAIPVAGSPVRYAVERYSFFQGTLRLAGRVEAASLPVVGLELVLPGGAAWPVPFARGGSGRFTFDATLAVPRDVADLARASLRVRLGDGTLVRIASPGEPVGDAAHALTGRFQAMLRERPAGQLLEVGSRARSGVVRRDMTPAGWAYRGFDIMAGSNVDVTGDAHELSRHFAPGQFDAVMAYSVLEHLLMPWKFVIELNRVLAVGAVGLFTTHQCWPLHDEPWDYWRFSDRAWDGLLNAATGFEIIEARMGEPAFVVAQRCHPATAFAEVPAGALASFVLFRKVAETTLAWPVSRGAITDTAYPTHTTTV